MREKTDSHGGGSKVNLSMRDWFLLPIVSVTTICLIYGCAEWKCRKEVTQSYSCVLKDDGAFGTRNPPNSTCIDKVFEAPAPAQYEFNSCGDRALAQCGQKPEGVYRIVVTGSSVAFGARVAREETFAAILPKDLSRRTARDVQVYNKGIFAWGTPRVVASRMNEVLAEQPDLILLIVTPWDVEHASVLVSEMPKSKPNQSESTRSKSDFLSQSQQGVSEFLRNHSLLASWLQHLMLESNSQLVSATLIEGESADFLRASYGPAWRDHLEEFETQFAAIATRAAAAKVPLAAVLIPDRAEATMVWMGASPKGYDPYKLDRELRSVVASHGGIYLDILPGFQSIPDPGSNYYPIDGHPDGNGQKVISDLLSEALIAGQIRALKISPSTPTGMGNQR